MIIKLTIGSNIKKLREAKGLSIYMLAKLTGVTQSNLWEIENGKRIGHPKTWKKLADFFGLEKPDDLFNPDLIDEIVKKIKEE